jgi:Zn-dependent M28 family amino/carboxypeptidase
VAHPPDVPSANVVGDPGQRAERDRALGAHDSWDGLGASDDAAGCVAVMVQCSRRDGGLDVRRTVRAVPFTGEEYLLAGSRRHAATHGAERHVAAFETDYGRPWTRSASGATSGATR